MMRLISLGVAFLIMFSPLSNSVLVFIPYNVQNLKITYYGENVGGPFTEENVRYTMIHGWGHEDHSYLVGLYNSLQLFFRKTGGNGTGLG